jgi:DNA-binding LacI/PurR family transcriptional regulator
MKHMKRATVQAIAKEANVSLATVSYVLNGKGSISPETRERILTIARQMDYVPNRAARALRGARSNTIGVIINHMHNPFFTEVFKGIEKIADESGLTYFVSQTHDDPMREHRQLVHLAQNGVDGIILLSGTKTFNHITAIEEQYGIPIILIGNYFEEVPLCGVVANNYQGGQLATQHLLALDSRKIIHIAGPQHQSMCSYRAKAFVDELVAAKKEVSGSIYHVSQMATESGYRIMEKIIEEQPLPLSIFAVNDETALGVLRFCRERKLRVPEDIAVVGFSDIELIRTMDTNLTTVRIPAKSLGEKAAHMLIKSIGHEGPKKECHLSVLPVELIVRGSTTFSDEA